MIEPVAQADMAPAVGSVQMIEPVEGVRTIEAVSIVDPAEAGRAKVMALLDLHGDDHDDHEEDPVARAFSTYSAPLKIDLADLKKGERASQAALYRVRRDELWPTDRDDNVDPWAQTTHDMLRAHILGPYFPCVGARAAFSQRTYRVGYYRDLAHPASVVAHLNDLRRFVKEYETFSEHPDEGFCSFVTLFKHPQSTTEDQFEELLFRHLQMLHDADSGSAWDPHYSADPNDPNFAFSIGGCAFFIVGFHAGSSRLSRLLPRPALVFNPESQIRRLKEHHQLEHFANAVRKRDTRYQGGPNPSLPSDVTSTGGETGVYSGKKHVPGDPLDPFQCPLKMRPGLLKSSG